MLPLITLLTDFGLTEHYVGTMKGVILCICPQATLVDLSHDIAPYGISEAAFTLAQAAPYFPRGTVHLVVVDPGVGSSRRAIVAEAAGQYFVAPDNGVLTMVEPAEVREILSPDYQLASVSSTFHGRDVFAPVAAHLAKGVSPQKIGPQISDAVKLDGLVAERFSHGVWRGRVLKVDRFGNLITSLRCDAVGPLTSGAFELQVGDYTVTQFSRNYAGSEAGPFAICGSSGYIEIAINQGDAAHALGVRPGDRVGLRPA